MCGTHGWFTKICPCSDPCLTKGAPLATGSPAPLLATSSSPSKLPTSCLCSAQLPPAGHPSSLLSSATMFLTPLHVLQEIPWTRRPRTTAGMDRRARTPQRIKLGCALSPKAQILAPQEMGAARATSVCPDPSIVTCP